MLDNDHLLRDSTLNELLSIIPSGNLLQYRVETKIDDIVEFHDARWRAGESDLVLTTYPEVAQHFNDQGIPAQNLELSYPDIFHALQLTSERVKKHHYRSSQTTAIIIRVADFARLSQQHTSGYQLQLLLLELKKIMLHLCERLSGVLVEQDNASFSIYTTLDNVQEHSESILSTINEVSITVNQAVHAGVGHADTASNASRFAHQALAHLKDRDESAAMSMHDDGTIQEILANTTGLSYDSRSFDADLIERLRNVNLSPKIYSKLVAATARLQQKSFGAKDVAHILITGQRNAQRIISELLKADLIEITGTEQRSTRGRAANVYRLKTPATAASVSDLL